MGSLVMRNWLLVLAVALLSAGCSSNCPVCDKALLQEIPPEYFEDGEYYCGDDREAVALGKLNNTIEKEDTIDVLLISGGGYRGSFGAGILYEWQNSEPFDIVTGISTGAIIATWAYLGRDHETKPYEVMKTAYEGGIKWSQISKRRWLFPLVDSMYTLAPLKKTLLKVVPKEMILEVGRIYDDEGRQIWIGSTNLETGQFCHWNLGKIGAAAVEANQNGDVEEVDRLVEHYHNLIIASSANPTVFKSQKIHGFEHVDGGVSETIFVERLDQIADEVAMHRKNGKTKHLNVSAIVNGRLLTPQKCVGPNVFSLATRSISILSKSATRGNLDRIKLTVDESFRDVVRTTGDPELGKWTYRTAWIPYDQPLKPADQFHKEAMSDLFCVGRKFDSWCKGVPGIHNTGEHCKLRHVGLASCGRKKTDFNCKYPESAEQ